MDNPEVSMPPAAPLLQGTPPAPVGPEQQRPLDTDPFGEPTRTERAAGGVRRRISGAIAAVVAVVAKFFAAIKGAVLLLPKLKLLTTAGTALVSVAAYSLFWGWGFAAGFVLLHVRTRDGARDPAAP